MIALRTRLHPSRARVKMDSDPACTTTPGPGFAADTFSQLQDRPKMPNESTRLAWARASRAVVDARVLEYVRAWPGSTRIAVAIAHDLKKSRIESAVARLRASGDLARCGELVPRIGRHPRTFDSLAEHLYRWIADVGGTGPEYAAEVGETVRRVSGVRGTLSCLGLVEPHGTLWTPAQVAARREDARWALRGWL